jgi:hypothetical protein
MRHCSSVHGLGRAEINADDSGGGRIGRVQAINANISTFNDITITETDLELIMERKSLSIIREPIYGTLSR